MSSVHFIIAFDWVMRTTPSENNTVLKWTICTTLKDMDYDNDLAQLLHTEDYM